MLIVFSHITVCIALNARYGFSYVGANSSLNILWYLPVMTDTGALHTMK